MVAVHLEGVILFLLPALLIRSGIARRHEGDACAVGGPRKRLDARLGLGELLGLATGDGESVHLRLAAAGGEERDEAPIRGPARLIVDGLVVGETDRGPAGGRHHPEIRIRAALLEIRDGERIGHPPAIRRELDAPELAHGGSLLEGERGLG